MLRSQRRYDDAATHWAALSSLRSARTALRHEATEALAVHFEHRRRDLERAQSWAERSRTPDATRSAAERLDRRLERLRRKLAGARAAGEARRASPGLYDGLY